MRRHLLALTLTTLLPGIAGADLLNAWDQALRNDQAFASAIADRDAEHEEIYYAQSQLLPQASAQYGRGTAESAITNAISSRDTEYETESWSVQLRQPVFKPRAIAAYTQAEAKVSAADQRLVAARQTLAIKLVDAWAERIAQLSLREAAALEIEAGKTLTRLTERQLKAGETTRLERTRAQLKLTEARKALTEADRRDRTSRTLWKQITGRLDLPPAAVPDSLAARLVADAGKLDDLDKRILQHPSLKAAQADVEAAQAEIRKAQSERLPSIDLVLSRGFNNQDTENTIGSQFDTTRILLQASMPLFTSGAISSTVREAKARQRRATATLESARQEIYNNAEGAWLDLMGTLTRYQAGEAALEQAKAALRTAELGIPAGQSTLADLATAQSDYAIALRTRSDANSDSLRLWARWQDALGLLDETALKRLGNMAAW